MKIKFFKPVELNNPKLKATVHKSGKLGFTIVASKVMGFEKNRGADIGIDEDDKEDHIVIRAKETKGDFTIAKAGDYYYINTKYLFDKLGYDYKANLISFKIIEVNVEGFILFKLKKNSHKRGLRS